MATLLWQSGYRARRLASNSRSAALRATVPVLLAKDRRASPCPFPINQNNLMGGSEHAILWPTIPMNDDLWKRLEVLLHLGRRVVDAVVPLSMAGRNRRGHRLEVSEHSRKARLPVPPGASQRMRGMRIDLMQVPQGTLPVVWLHLARACWPALQ
jgi:hypothetical protein